MLAFALAANERNIAAGDFELAANERERRDAKRTMERAHSSCHELRNLILDHCRQHGC